MAYQPLEELLPQAGNSVYRLVRIASIRATELATTGVKLVPAPAEQKLATTALNEILIGKVVGKTEDMSASPKKEKSKKND